MQAQAEIAHAQTASHKRVRRIRKPQLFGRWFALVYFPLFLLALGFVLFLFGALPSWGKIALVLIALWGVAAVRLITVQRKLGMRVPLPRDLVVGLCMVAGSGTLGMLFVWGGLNRLATNTGAILLFLGGALILTAAIAPVMKVVDVGVRAVARSAVRLRRTASSRPD